MDRRTADRQSIWGDALGPDHPRERAASQAAGAPAQHHVPQPTFHADLRRVVEWWEQSTDPATRFQPPETLRSRLAPSVLAVSVVLLIVVGFALVKGIPG